ncbi:DUF2147 domain-containing protein [Collimonas pratensis]|uniref:Uncharacterized protein n=1 Tax=Collimonas pratensis TaxID=279113 RepID=A0A127QBX1_9BURK|nr:DUF2147 domain-containing protein [Collimonas pratensis]AMP07569.1 hypothetical protein CPter91_5283 [Collimonas pratensis]
MKKIAMFALIFATCMSQAAPAFSQADKVPSKTAGSAGPLGKWVTESGNLEVDIAPCGAALCGSVSRVISNRSMSPGGEAPKADALPLAGLKSLSDFSPTAKANGTEKSTIAIKQRPMIA